jgi:hypothetical protein
VLNSGVPGDGHNCELYKFVNETYYKDPLRVRTYIDDGYDEGPNFENIELRLEPAKLTSLATGLAFRSRLGPLGQCALLSGPQHHHDPRGEKLHIPMMDFTVQHKKGPKVLLEWQRMFSRVCRWTFFQTDASFHAWGHERISWSDFCMRILGPALADPIVLHLDLRWIGMSLARRAGSLRITSFTDRKPITEFKI